MKKKQKDPEKRKRLEQALIVAKGQQKVKLHEKYLKGDE